MTKDEKIKLISLIASNLAQGSHRYYYHTGKMAVEEVIGDAKHIFDEAVKLVEKETNQVKKHTDMEVKTCDGTNPLEFGGQLYSK